MVHLEKRPSRAAPAIGGNEGALTAIPNVSFSPHPH